jgi:predicted nucleotidyltransferase
MPGISITNLRQRIEAIAGAQAEVRIVYLFGSQIDGEIGPLSDVDLGVLLAPGAPVARIRAQLAPLFSEALRGVPVDLIILNRAPIELAYAVIAQGKVLYEQGLSERVEYEADTMSRYGDYLPFLRAQRQAILAGADDERRVHRYREALGRTQRALGTPGTPAR